MSNRGRHSTTPEDLEALSCLAWFLSFLKQAERNVPDEHKERAAYDYRALAHCHKLLEEMLSAGLSPVGEGEWNL
jgi:hypothetical protein